MKSKILLFILGIYTLLNGIGIISLKYYYLSFTIKFLFLFFITTSLWRAKQNSISTRHILFVLIGLMISIYGSKIHKEFEFFPYDFGTYKLKIAYYKDDSLNYKSQDRIEYFTKDYALNNTAEKYEKVTIYFWFIEYRKEIYSSNKEFEFYKYVDYFNGYNPT